MITGERVRLRPVEDADHPDIQRWANQEETWWWEDLERPLSLDDVRDREARARLEGHPFIIEVDGRSVGRIGLSDVRRRDRIASLSVLAGEPDAWDARFGVEAIRVLLDHAFGRLDLHMVELSCIEANARALAASEAAGFRRDAVLRERSWKDGRWHDRIVMSITREEFEASS